MLLAIQALDSDPDGPSIGRLAEQMVLRHHSAVGLMDRLEARGLATRSRGVEGDRRQVRIRLTELGAETLRRLAALHQAELRTSGPLLVESLQRIIEQTPEPAR